MRRLEQESDFGQWEAMLTQALDHSRIMVRDGMVYYLPKCFDRSWNLRYLRTGLLLGEWKKNRFEPSQAACHGTSDEGVFPDRILVCRG